jgi:outer membrane protein OmpA-like peptidoglycan-associated protein
MGSIAAHAAARRSLAALILWTAASWAAAAQAPYADAWDPAAVAAAEAAVARLGARTFLEIRATVVDIKGMATGIGGGTSGIVATVQQVRQAMQDLGATETAIEVRVDLPADVLFDFDKASIRPDAAQALGKLATVIRGFPSAQVLLEGHTDSVGNDAYNQSLSERRADAVKTWLVGKEALEAARFRTQGFGESKPVASNDTDQGRQKNRRVVAVIHKQP